MQLRSLCCGMLAALLLPGTPGAQSGTPVDPYNPEVVPGVVLVRFEDSVTIPVAGSGPVGKLASVAGLPDLADDYGVTSVERLFPQAPVNPPARKITAYDGSQHQVGSLHNIFRLKLRDGVDPRVVAKGLAGQQGVEYAEPDYVCFIPPARETGPAAGTPITGRRRGMSKPSDAGPTDPLYADQWYLGPFPGANVTAAWNDVADDSTQTIAIIDTGVDWTHPDLDDNIWINRDEVPDNGVDDDGNGYTDDVRGWDFVNRDSDPRDDNSHGTHVAGIAAAEGGNGTGIVGVAPHARIMPVKVMQSTGRGSMSDLASGVAYAWRNGATVINLSVGGYVESVTLRHALENAYPSAVIVAAAGNDRRRIEGTLSTPFYPACYSFVLGVQASSPTGARAAFSNYDPSGPISCANAAGLNYEATAPGVAVCSTFPSGGYRFFSGTSMAAPIVAGAVALMRTHRPGGSTEELWASLIHSEQNGVQDIGAALDLDPAPDLRLVNWSLMDTLAGGDRDGNPDAGETLDIGIAVRNAGGRADSVWARLRLAEHEDPAVVSVEDSSSQFGSLSSYASAPDSRDPFRVRIASSVANFRDIRLEYELACRGSATAVTGELVLTARNQVEIAGYRPGLTTLTPDREYWIRGIVLLDSIDIRPGVTVHIPPRGNLIARQYLRCQGTADSMITITHTRPEDGWPYWSIFGTSGAPVDLAYCIIEYGGWLVGMRSVTDCIFRLVGPNPNASPIVSAPRLLRNVVTENSHDSYDFTRFYPKYFPESQGEVAYNTICRNNIRAPIRLSAQALPSIRNNAIFGNYPEHALIVDDGPFGVYHAAPNYYGTLDSASVNHMVLDYLDGVGAAIVYTDSALADPPAECHGLVAGIEFDGQDLRDDSTSPFGVQTVRVSVRFNRPMDTSYSPLCTFGVRPPYTQHRVADNPAWSSDSTVWAADYSIGTGTGDGLNTVRVSGARDDEGFEIPIEDARFRFTVQAAGAASVDFVAEAGVGKVYLEWPGAAASDALGYNVYRSTALTDTTFADPVVVNPVLVTDTTYTDFAVTPNTRYLYQYRTVSTDMVESDPSKSVVATPVGAASGDANGDMAVNVLDIVAVVNYVLEERPEPFLAEAADANQDGRIDVLDVVRIVRTILGLPKVADTSPVAATGELTLEDGSIVLRSTVPVAGLQFTLTGPQLSDLRLTPTEALRGMETGSATRDGQATYVVYSLSRTVLPTGSVALFRVEGALTLKVRDVVLSDVDGRTIPTAVTDDESAALPTSYGLGQNYPNPLNPETTIRFALPEPSDLRLTLCNLLGQEIRVLRQGRAEAGYHRIVWDGRDDRGRAVASGVYLYRLDAGPYTATRKLVVLK